MKTNFVMTVAGRLLAIITVLIALSGPVVADEIAGDVLAAVVKVHSEIPADARTARLLGTEREGSGVVIDADGLILTIGYLIIEASKAEVIGPNGQPVTATIVGYDYDSGFGLLRAAKPLGVKPMELGQSSEIGERDQVLVAGYGGSQSVRPALVASRRDFAGYWEYLLEDAIFTAPPYPNFGGAALIGRNGQLLGIGSLFVNDALSGERSLPGNMFVPIDRLKPILDDLLANGRTSEPPRPWLGVFTEEHRGHVFITGVIPDGPADEAGLRPGDMVVGVAGETVKKLADFYRKVWAQGHAGVAVSLNVLREAQVRDLVIRSIDRSRYYRSGPSHQQKTLPEDATSV